MRRCRSSSNKLQEVELSQLAGPCGPCSRSPFHCSWSPSLRRRRRRISHHPPSATVMHGGFRRLHRPHADGDRHCDARRTDVGLVRCPVRHLVADHGRAGRWSGGIAEMRLVVQGTQRILPVSMSGGGVERFERDVTIGAWCGWFLWLIRPGLFEQNRGRPCACWIGGAHGTPVADRSDPGRGNAGAVASLISRSGGRWSCVSVVTSGALSSVVLAVACSSRSGLG